jgi:phosphatidylserine/phosphatidylglycerophosphate/cardiolipin synthase-like enzyme
VAEFLTTNGISSELEKVIQGAQQRIVLISPYLRVSARLRDYLTQADILKKDIRIVFGKADLKPGEHEWLSKMDSLKLSYRENLHAKCYFNETRAIVTSMNLYEFSQQNNDEMGILVTAEQDKDLYAKVTQDAERIILLSTSWKIPFERVIEPVSEAPPPAPVRRGRTTAVEPAKVGHCIRCAGEIPLDPLKPYCANDYAKWAEYENPDYKDKYCHACGKKHVATMRRPLCRDCYE